VRVPAALDHHRAAGPRSRQEAVHEAGYVKERRGRERDRLGCDVLPGGCPDHVVQDGGMRVHASLRAAGAARRVRHQAQVGRARDRRRGVVAAKRGLARDNQVREREPCETGSHLLLDNRDSGVTVLDVMRELGRDVHRCERYRHRIGTQDRKARDHPVGAILHVEQHPVAAPNAADLLQVPGECVRASANLGPRKDFVLENRRRLVREPVCRRLEARLQRGFGRREVARQVRRPECEVAVFHQPL
jgi:hypothetical protein